MVRSERVLVVDIDGTLTGDKPTGQGYGDVPPAPRVLQRLRELKEQGYWIILFTARNMRTHDGNLGLIMRHTAPVVFDWLAQHDVPFDEIHFGKPWCGHDGFYVDDRAIRPREFVELSVEQIHAVITRDRDLT